MGRTSDARQRILDAACELMHSRSYGAVGVAEICQRADVKKGSFYHFFPSKQVLTIEVIDAHWESERGVWLEILQATEPTLERLRRLFEESAATHHKERDAFGMVSGCVLANLALELSTRDHVVQERLREVFDEQIELIEELLHEAVSERAIPPGSATHATARAVVAQMEGMVLFAKLGNDPGILVDLWPQTLLLLRAFEVASPA